MHNRKITYMKIHVSEKINQSLKGELNIYFSNSTNSAFMRLTKPEKEDNIKVYCY